MEHEATNINIVEQPTRSKAYNPYAKYSSSESVTLGTTLVEDWDCSLVEPKHPILKKRATTDPFSGNLDWYQREREMCELMQNRFGIGLAAPQVGSSYRMFVMNHSHLGEIGIYKPEILEVEGKSVIEEGCLSFPLLFMNITRPERIKVRYTKTDGKTVVETWMDGMDARCFLHEYDHLEGKLFIDDASDFKLRRAMEKQQKRIKQLRNIGRDL